MAWLLLQYHHDGAGDVQCLRVMKETLLQAFPHDALVSGRVFTRQNPADPLLGWLGYNIFQEVVHLANKVVSKDQT